MARWRHVFIRLPNVIQQSSEFRNQGVAYGSREKNSHTHTPYNKKSNTKVEVILILEINQRSYR